MVRGTIGDPGLPFSYKSIALDLRYQEITAFLSLETKEVNRMDCSKVSDKNRREFPDHVHPLRQSHTKSKLKIERSSGSQGSASKICCCYGYHEKKR
jgi:hypothetical protein